MRDVDGNFCDGNGRLLPQTGEEYVRQLEDEKKKNQRPAPRCFHLNVEDGACVACGA